MLIKQVIGSELSLTDQFPNSTDWLNQFLKNAELSLFLSPSINLERFAHFHHYIGIVQPVWQLLRQVQQVFFISSLLRMYRGGFIFSIPGGGQCMCVCICVCIQSTNITVCMYMTEREQEREIERQRQRQRENNNCPILNK